MDQKNSADFKVASKHQPPIVFFVLPCFNEQDMLRYTAKILAGKVNGLISSRSINNASRVLFVDDGSQDSTWQIIQESHQLYGEAFGGIRLAHNKGHQNALYAGLMTALDCGCDAAISMDADLQDDVSVLDRFLEAFHNGSEIVYGVRSTRTKDSWFKRSTAEAFYKIFRAMGAETIPDHADYRLMGKKSLLALSQYHEVNLFLRGIVPTLGFQTSKVYYERGERKAGESKYPLKKMISFAVQGITSFSTKPLHAVAFLGGASVLVGILMFIYVIWSWLSGSAISGWGSLMCSVWLIGGLVMMSIAIVGEYVGKIYLETKERPRYFIEEKL